VVTVVFADLAGSTALGESLDPEDVRAVQAELYELVNAEVERHGGVTEKFVGDAILAVFGAPQAHEDDADRAVRAALAVRDAFPAFAATVSERHRADVGIRIGVNTGEVIAGREAAARGELMVSGDVVNVAARLQQLANPGTVLVGERTWLATQRAIAYGEARVVDAKGKEAPLRVHEALAPGARELRRAPTHSAPLVGREHELELLRLTATRVERERTPQLVTIFGSAGVGKTRLLDEFCDSLDGARVVVGRCVPYGDGITYLPLVDVARQLTGVLDDDRAEAAFGKVRRSVEATVAPEQVEKVAAALAWTTGLELPAETTGVAFAGDARRTLHEGWTAYVAALGRERLLVLVLDDIHWASEPLLDVLDDVMTVLEDTAVLVLCPSRPELLEIRPTWGTGRLRSSSLTLAPLGAGDAEGLLRALLRDENVAADAARAILEPAEGNPFFVEEMLAMLVEQGALEKRNGGWSSTPALATLKVPDSIHGVIAARIDLLAAAERDALRRCSVMGRVFWPSAVDIEDDVVATLARTTLVSEQPESSFSGRREFAFKHALTHEVAYATLPRSERRELHRRVAEWLVKVVPDREAEIDEIVAYHYEQALEHGEREPELEGRTFVALLDATDSLVRRGSYTTAASLARRALEIAPSEDSKARALLLAAQVDVHIAENDRAISRLDETIAIADRGGDRALRADALGWKSRASWLRGRWRDALELSEAAVAALEGESSSAELARALARLSQIQMLRSLPAAETTALRAIEVARENGETAAEANARANLFTSRASRIEPSTDEVAEIVELAVRGGAHDEAVRAVVNYLWSAWLYSPLEVIEKTVADAKPQLEQGLTAEAYAQYLRLSLAVLVYVPAGRWPEADEIARADNVSTSASNRLVWHWLASALALRRGDLELVDGLLPEFRKTALASEEPQRIVPMVSVAMPRALLAGDSSEIRALVDAVVGLPPMAAMSAAAVVIYRVLAAAEERDELQRLARHVESAGSFALAASATAHGLSALLAGDAIEAAAQLHQAESQLRALGRHYEAACLALDLARTLDATGDAEEADAARGRAQPLLDRLGCVNPW
jgi:predicted ATPase/class 3 adenylate cyclase